MELKSCIIFWLILFWGKSKSTLQKAWVFQGYDIILFLWALPTELRSTPNGFFAVVKNLVKNISPHYIRLLLCSIPPSTPGTRRRRQLPRRGRLYPDMRTAVRRLISVMSSSPQSPFPSSRISLGSWALVRKPSQARPTVCQAHLPRCLYYLIGYLLHYNVDSLITGVPAG